MLPYVCHMPDDTGHARYLSLNLPDSLILFSQQISHASQRCTLWEIFVLWLPGCVRISVCRLPVMADFAHFEDSFFDLLGQKIPRCSRVHFVFLVKILRGKFIWSNLGCNQFAHLCHQLFSVSYFFHISQRCKLWNEQSAARSCLDSERQK